MSLKRNDSGLRSGVGFGAAKGVFGWFGFIRENPEAMTGIAVLAMFLAGMGSMKGMQAHLLAQPENSIAFVAMAYLLLFGAEIVGVKLNFGFGSCTADHRTMFGSCGTILGGVFGASGRISVCRGCVTRTGIERIVCRA